MRNLGLAHFIALMLLAHCNRTLVRLFSGLLPRCAESLHLGDRTKQRLPEPDCLRPRPSRQKEAQADPEDQHERRRRDRPVPPLRHEQAGGGNGDPDDETAPQPTITHQKSGRPHSLKAGQQRFRRRQLFIDALHRVVGRRQVPAGTIDPSRNQRPCLVPFERSLLDFAGGRRSFRELPLGLVPDALGFLGVGFVYRVLGPSRFFISLIG